MEGKSTIHRYYGISAMLLIVVGIISIYLGSHTPNRSESTTLKTNPFNKGEPLSRDSGSVISAGISYGSFKYGLSQCQQITKQQQEKQDKNKELPRRQRNPRGPTNTTLLIKNGYIWLGDRYLDGGDILIKDGLILEVGHGLSTDEDNVQEIDAKGRVVSPGIVDMHTHATVYSLPGLQATADVDELSDSATPYVRVIDAINPIDPAIKLVSSGGVTTTLVLPGSDNLMGGEAAVIKLCPVSTLSNQDMLVTAGVDEEQDREKIWRYMKMSCGENAKAHFGPLNQMPITRMGEAYILRQRFEEARFLKRQQDDWCDAAHRISESLDEENVDEDKITRLSEPYPESLKLESLVALLRHQINLNIHCYLPHDMESFVQHSLEFDFEIAAFHHALSAWQVTEILKRAKTNITIATFAGLIFNSFDRMD
ncbi:hypothetical protein INT45_014298, partial [Circinella minor]